MQLVSDAYRESMATPLRNRGYIIVAVGKFDFVKQQRTSFVFPEGNHVNNCTYFSRLSAHDVFKLRTVDKIYATLEQNFTKADGSMYFLPSGSYSSDMYDNGFVSNKLVSEGTYRFGVRVSGNAIENGFTIDFGENYPLDFDVIIGSTTINVRGNSSSKWENRNSYTNVSQIDFVIYSMKNAQSRLRINLFMYGYGIFFTNNDVINAVLDGFSSGVCVNVPQIDFSVKVKNENHQFDIGNPNAETEYFETGNDLIVAYGCELPNGKTEWLEGKCLYIRDWDSDEDTTLIQAQDVIRAFNATYYRAFGGTLKSTIGNILEDAGIADYTVDEAFRKLMSTSFMPVVSTAEALQMAVNAGCGKIILERHGSVTTRPNVIPPMEFRSYTRPTTYARTNNALNTSKKQEYATLATNYTKADGSMYFLPRDLSGGLNTGYVSNVISDANGNIYVSLTMDSNVTQNYGTVHIVFGESLPAVMYVRKYDNNDDNNYNDQLVPADKIKRDMVYQFNDFVWRNKITFIFTKTAEPYNRIVINHISVSNASGFVMTKNDMTTYPRLIKQPLVKDIIIPYYISNGTGDYQELYNQNITVNYGDVQDFIFSDNSYNIFEVRLNGSTSGFIVTLEGVHFVRIRFEFTGTRTLVIKGRPIYKTERQYVKSLNESGEIIRWDNPLSNEFTVSQDYYNAYPIMPQMELLANWIADYYSSPAEYEYECRGFPEIDAGDIIFQETDFEGLVPVEVYSYTLNFDQTFSAKVVARRKGG